jgi:hypothetical protein
MRNIDLVQEYTPVIALLPQSIAAATNGANIDMQQFNGGAIELAVGAGGNVTFKIQDAPDVAGAPGAFADVLAPATVDGGLPSVVVNASSVGQLRLDPTHLKRWVRVVATPTAAVPASAVALLHKPRA